MGDDLFKVKWTQPARQDLKTIVAEIAENAPLRAIRFGEKIRAAAESLRWGPFRCSRATEDPSCRHFIIKKYRIIFEIDEDDRIVWVRAVMFPDQQYKPRS